MTDFLSPFDPLIVLQNAVQGRFAVERELGRGGMGIVYLARDLALDRPVAIKMLPPLAALAVVSRERFIREARITASLSHPNILPVHTFEVRDDCAFFVMAFVDGETLEQRVRRVGPLDAESGMRILREVAWALDHAHLRGVVHRDVKPGNIMLERDGGRALVSDFGIAQGPYESLTSPGDAVGTKGFASPEQIAGEAADLLADIYGLGATAWFVFTGGPPESARESTLPSKGLRAERADVPSRVAGILSQCLSAQPEDRPDSAGEVAEAMSTGLDRAGVIPAPLKSWLVAGQSLTIPLLLWTVYPFMSLGWPWRFSMNTRYYMYMLSLPWLAFGLFRCGRLLLLVNQGYGITDIRTTLHDWRRRSNLRLAVDNRNLPARLSRTVRWGTYVALGLAFTVTTADWLHPWPSPWMSWHRRGVDYAVLAFNLALVGAIVGWIWPRWGRPERDHVADMRVRFWDSRLGAWLASTACFLGRVKLRGGRSTLAPIRHTEVVLHAGVSSLHAALQAPLSDRLADLPATAADLERQALEIRGAMGRLRDLESSALPPSAAVDSPEHQDVLDELVARRNRLEERHLEVIGALERLRLGLMRLVARAEMPSGITGSLEEAEELTQLLGLLDEARRTVEEPAKLTAGGPNQRSVNTSLGIK